MSIKTTSIQRNILIIPSARESRFAVCHMNGTITAINGKQYDKERFAEWLKECDKGRFGRIALYVRHYTMAQLRELFDEFCKEFDFQNVVITDHQQ